jgi:hypothetical protein
MKPYGLNNRPKQQKPEKSVPREAWTRAEFDKLKVMRAAGMGYDDIAVALGRTGQSVRSKSRDQVFTPARSSGVFSKGWPVVGTDLLANDDAYVARLIEAAKLEGCYRARAA